jgi:hypothetical protein
MTATPLHPALAPEADPDRAPALLDGALALELAADECSVDYWVANVAQGTLTPERTSGVQMPWWMLEEGPLRAAVSEEFAFRSLAEDKATRAITYLVANAPDTAGMEFFSTQLLDEARHASAFRNHLADVGYSDPEATRQALAHQDAARVLEPLEEFGLGIGRDAGDYVGGVVVLTVLVEGVLAPAAELSERKWHVLDPVAARIERIAGVDEIRHLTVGSSVVREYLLRHPGERHRLNKIVREGRTLWADLPIVDVLWSREVFFQEGMQSRAAELGDYEIWPGRRLIDTTPEERLLTAAEWSQRLQDHRLAYMGLDL